MRNLMKTENRPFFDLAKRFFNEDFNYFDSPVFTMKNGGLSNISEKENEYLIELTAPGLKKEDIKIELDNDILRISSVSEDEKEENDGYYRREFYKSSFERSFTIPKIADKNSISATMVDGILSVSIPKLKEEKKPDNIEIKIK